MGYIESHRFNLSQRRGGRGRTCGKDFDNVIKVALLIIGGIDQHVQNDRGPAEMRNFFIRDRIKNSGCRDIATADNCTPNGRHHPCVTPSVTMEQGNDGQISGVQGDAPTDHLAHGVQIGPAVMINHTLWAARRARGIVQRNAFPFVLWHDPLKIRIPIRQQRIIGCVPSCCGEPCGGIWNLDQCGACTAILRDCSLGQFDELRINQRNLGPTMIKNVGHGVYVQACVDRVKDCTTGGNTKMRLGMGGDIW